MAQPAVDIQRDRFKCRIDGAAADAPVLGPHSALSMPGQASLGRRPFVNQLARLDNEENRIWMSANATTTG